LYFRLTLCYYNL